MNKEALKRIFEFLEDKEQQNPPFMWKLLNNISLTKEELNVKGDLILTYTDIESLPEGLEVGHGLDLSNSKIKSLPKGLKVGGTLFLSKTNITSLPEGLEVGGNLYVGVTKLTKYTDDELREMIKPGFIEGKIKR